MNQEFETFITQGMRAQFEVLFQDLHECHAAYCRQVCSKYKADTHGQFQHTIRCDEMARKYGVSQRSERNTPLYGNTGS